MMAYGRALKVAVFSRKRSWVSGSPPAWVVRCRQEITERQHPRPNQVRRPAAFARIHRMRCRPPSFRPVSPLRKTARCALLLFVVTLFVLPLEAAAQRAPSLRIAVALTLSGPAANIGAEVLEGLRMGIEDAGRQHCRSTWPSSTTEAMSKARAMRRVASQTETRSRSSAPLSAPWRWPWSRSMPKPALPSSPPISATDATAGDLPPEPGPKQGW